MLDRLPDFRRLRRVARVGLRRVRAWVLRVWRNEPARERAQAIAAFACIFAFTVASIDYLITGGPDWTPGGEAYAMEAPQTAAPVAAPLLAPQAMAAPREVAIEEPDYRFTTEELLGGPEGEFMPAALALPEAGDDSVDKTAVRAPKDGR